MRGSWQGACKALLAVTCLAPWKNEANCEENKPDARIAGTWVLTAIGRGEPFNPSNVEFVPVEDQHLLYFVFDEDAFHVHMKDQAPLHLRYQFQPVSDQAMITIWRSSGAHSVFQGALHGDTFYAEISTSDGLFFRPVDKDPEKTVYFKLERRPKLPEKETPSPLDGVWRLVKVTRGDETLIGPDLYEAQPVFLTLESGELSLTDDGKRSKTLRFTCERSDQGDLTLLVNKRVTVAAWLDQDGRSLRLTMGRLMAKESGFLGDEVFHYEKAVPLADELMSRPTK